MKRFVFALAGVLAFTVFADEPKSGPPSARVCTAGGTWESGIISATQSLRGPFVLLSLSSGVDPARAKHQFVILNDPTGRPAIGNEWLDVDGFRGPLFMGEGAVITGRADFTPRDVIYSGCRL